MAFLLLCRTGDDAGLAHPVEGGRCLVGRGEDCQLALLHPQLSREHALVTEEAGRLLVEDLDSSNGTQVNGLPLVPGLPSPLRHLDRLTLGPEVEFVVLDLERVPRTEVVAAHLLDAEGERVPLQLGDNKIGSSDQSDLIVTDEAVSPVHAHLELSAAGLLLRRAEGARVLRVNGREVESLRLEDGDRIELSPQASFAIEIFFGLAETPEAHAAHAADQTRPEAELVEPSEAEADRESAETSQDEEEDATATLEQVEIHEAMERVKARREAELAQRALDLQEARQAGTAGPGAASAHFDEDDGTVKHLRRTWSTKLLEPDESAPPPTAFRAVRREAAVRLSFTLPGSHERQGTLLREGRHLVGRQEGCRLVLADPTVSREHAEIQVGPQGILVRDLDSANGTWVDGERIDEVTLHDGDAVRFGRVDCRLEEI